MQYTKLLFIFLIMVNLSALDGLLAQAGKQTTPDQNSDKELFHKNFTLKGVHLQLDCDKCHGNNRPLKGTSEDCRFCHHHDDPHHGFLNPCSKCHSQTFWKMVEFNHNTSHFPLMGAHRMTDCKSCHRQGVYQGLPTDCIACHIKDAQKVPRPNHGNPNFQDCKRCHNQFTFDLPHRPVR